MNLPGGIDLCGTVCTVYINIYDMTDICCGSRRRNESELAFLELGLEYKMGAKNLKTVLIRDMNEI